MLLCAHVTQLNLAPANFVRCKFPIHIPNAVLDKYTDGLIEIRHLIKNPNYSELWGGLYGNELGRLAQGMPGRVEGNDTICFIDKQDTPTARWRDVTYGIVVVNYRP